MDPLPAADVTALQRGGAEETRRKKKSLLTRGMETALATTL